ncbi:hypothetical protein ACROYT_G016738 [Oculina patagonica]
MVQVSFCKKKSGIPSRKLLSIMLQVDPQSWLFDLKTFPQEVAKGRDFKNYQFNTRLLHWSLESFQAGHSQMFAGGLLTEQSITGEDQEGFE